MGIIKLTKNGVYFNSYGVKDNTEEDSVVDLNNLHYYYDYEVIIEDDYRVIDLIYLINNIYEKINYDFAHASRGVNIKQFINESLKEPNNLDEVCHRVIEIGWVSEIWDNQFEIYPNIYGYEKKDENDIKISYAFSPLYNWSHLPLLLNEKFDVYDYFNKDNPIVLSSKKTFKLYDLLYCFIYEITFNGDIENRNAILNQLMESVDDIETGKEKLHSFEEIILEYKKQNLEESIINEEYERASSLKKEIEELEKKIKNERY
jgi:hypothetical protein